MRNRELWIDRHLNMGDEGIAPTLCAKYGTGGNNMPCVLDIESEIYENHPMDSRITEIRGVMTTLNSRMGTGGGNLPLVRESEVYENHFMDSRVKGVSVCPTLSRHIHKEPDVIVREEKQMSRYVVRRITPKECERLQGFPTKGDVGPDGKILERDYTNIPWKGGDSPDAHRYKALGNSMAVPVMRFIGERIDWALANPITENISEHIDWQPDLFG